MIATIIGKKFVSGFNKRTGKYRCGTIIYTTYTDETVEGIAVKSFWVNTGVCPPEKIEIGKQYNLTEEHNYITVCEQYIQDMQED